MINAFFISTLNPLIRASYVVLVAGLAVGLIAIPFSLQLALLPAAVIFGWSQIGGL
jgi:hypothetical protein